MKKTNKLAMMLGLGGLNGHVALAATAGLFRPENAFSLAVLFMAGPAAILIAVLFDGGVKERMFAALLAGIIATVIVVLSAGLGPKLLSLLNLNIMRMTGGIAIMAIALLIMGIKIPEKVPTMIMIAGLVLSIIFR